MNPMTKARHAALLAAFLAAVPIGNGQQEPNTALTRLAFLTGRWVSGERTEAQEENWSPVIGNSMTGTLRILPSGTPVFYVVNAGMVWPFISGDALRIRSVIEIIEDALAGNRPDPPAERWGSRGCTSCPYGRRIAIS